MLPILTDSEVLLSYDPFVAGGEAGIVFLKDIARGRFVVARYDVCDLSGAKEYVYRPCEEKLINIMFFLAVQEFTKRCGGSDHG